jgi:hypothetical protein
MQGLPAEYQIHSLDDMCHTGVMGLVNVGACLPPALKIADVVTASSCCRAPDQRRYR